MEENRRKARGQDNQGRDNQSGSEADELVNQLINVLPQLSRESAKTLLHYFDYKIEVLVAAVFDNPANVMSLIDEEEIVQNADELPSFISISDDSLCEGNICLTEDLKNEDFSSLSVVKQEYISDVMTLSTSRDDSFETRNKEFELDESIETENYNFDSEDDDELPDLTTGDNNDSLICDDDDLMTSAASLPVLIPCDSGHRVSSTCNTESLIDNERKRKLLYSEVQVKKVQSSCSESSDSVICLSEEDDKDIASKSDIATREGAVTPAIGTGTITAVTDPGTVTSIINNTHNTVDCWNTILMSHNSYSNENAQLNASIRSTLPLFDLKRVQQAFKGVLHTSVATVRETSVETPVEQDNPRVLFSKPALTGFCANICQVRLDERMCSNQHAVYSLYDFLTSIATSNGLHACDNWSHLLCSIMDSMQPMTDEIMCIVKSHLSSLEDCVPLLKFAEILFPSSSERLQLTRNKFFSIVEEQLHLPSNEKLTQLDFLMTSFECNFTSKSPLSERQLSKTTLNRLFPYDDLSWIPTLVDMFIRASSGYHLQTLGVFDERCCTQVSLLQHLSHLLSLIVTATREPDSVSCAFAKEFARLWKSLPTSKRRKDALLTIARCPLLMMYVTQRILDNLCPHPPLNVICNVNFAKLSHLVNTFFCASPPRTELYCSPPLTPTNIIDDVAALMNDGNRRAYSPSDVEELAFLLYHLIESYITATAGLLLSPITTRAWRLREASTFGLDGDDKATLSQLPDKVNGLRVHLSSLCTHLTARTEMLLLRLSCLSSYC